MKKPLIIILVFLIFSCSKFEIVTDQYWETAFPGSALLSAEIKRNAFRRGFYIKVSMRDADTEQQNLSEHIRKSHAGIFLLSPLFSNYAEYFAKKFPLKFFFFFNHQQRNSFTDDNLIAIYGYEDVPFSRLEEKTEKLITFIVKKAARRDYSDIDLHDLE